MGKFPFSFRSKVSGDSRLDLALASNFDKAATEDFVTAAVAAGGGGGVSDHGALTGLADDDHAQYHNDTRGDARYQLLDADLTTIAALDSGTSAGVMATEAAGWVKRTYAQVKTSLGLVKADVGLGSVDNTSDASKPVSTAQQAALDLKANLASPTFSGTPSLPTGTTAVTQLTGDNDTSVATTGFVQQEITVHTGDATAAHAASAISVSAVANLTATDVQAALAEHQSDIDGLAAGSGIPGSTMDAKGDLIVGTADNTYSRRAAPSNTMGLVADSTSADGWRGEQLATQQALEDLRDEFEGHHHSNQSQAGRIVPGGRLVRTSTWTTGALAISSNSASMFSITITGNGVDTVEVRADANYLASAAFSFMFMLWDGTVGSGTCIGADWHQPPVGNTRACAHVVGEIAPFTGTKTINFAVQSSSAGGITVQGDAAAIAADRPARMIARFVNTNP